MVFAFSQLGAESADSIGAVLNSKDEQREIAETRETCRSVEYFFSDMLVFVKGSLF